MRASFVLSPVLSPLLLPTSSGPERRRYVASLLLLSWAAWTIIAVVVAVNEVRWTGSGASGGTVGESLRDALAHCVPFYWLWALLTPPIAVLASRAGQRRGAVRWGALALAAPVVGVTHLALYSVVWLLMTSGLEPAALTADLRVTLRHHMPGDLLTYAAVLAAWYITDRYRRTREQLAAAKLEALTAQLRPHFLFNALQVVSTLMHRDVNAADDMLTRLSELLRLTLRRESRELVPLREELELLDHYVAIMRERFGPRVTFALDVEPGARDALVPQFVLQPLVENAFQHGIAGRPGAGRVEVSARRVGGALVLAVADDGPGIGNGAPVPAERVGLSNARLRLRELFGANSGLAFDARPGGGLCVTATIPYAAANGAPPT